MTTQQSRRTASSTRSSSTPTSTRPARCASTCWSARPRAVGRPRSTSRPCCWPSRCARLDGLERRDPSAHVLMYLRVLVCLHTRFCASFVSGDAEQSVAVPPPPRRRCRHHLPSCRSCWTRPTSTTLRSGLPSSSTRPTRRRTLRACAWRRRNTRQDKTATLTKTTTTSNNQR